MSITLEKAILTDAYLLHQLLVKTFLPLLEKYQDHATNPACEPIDKTIERINSPSRSFYKIKKNNQLVGGIAIKHTSDQSIWIGPIFIDPFFQNEKIGQKAMLLIEKLFPDVIKFELATLSKEARNIHLYLKLGYTLTNRKEKINDRLDLVFFEKNRLKNF